MDMEKIIPPSYSLSSEMNTTKKTSKWSWILGIYSCAVTIALVTLCIISVLQIQQHKLRCDINNQEDMLDSIIHEENQHTPTKKYHVLNKDQSEDDVEVDKVRNREIIRIASGNDEYSLLVLDFKQNFGAIYDGETNSCFLIGGLDASLLDAEELEKQLENKTSTIGGMENELDYTIETERPVRDLGHLLPTELESICWGKPVYWLRTAQVKEHNDRQKRSNVRGGGCYQRCWNAGRGRICVWVCAGRG